MPTRIDFVIGSSEELGKVMLELKANARGALVSQSLRITEADLQGRSVAEILAAKGFLKETPELLAAYDASAARYFDWRGRYGGQFAGQGTAFLAEDPSATHRDTDWSRKDQVILSASGGSARLVNDEGILPPRGAGLESPGDILAPYLRRAAKSSDYDCEDEVKALDASLPKHLFTQLPVQAYLFMFHLELHHHLWVHVDDMRALRLPARAQAQAGAAARADRADRHPHRRDGRAAGRRRRRQGRRHHGAVRRPARRGQDAHRRGLRRGHAPPALPRAFGPAGLERGRDGRRR